MTRKQEVFVQEYLVDLNAAAAARRAGFAPKHASSYGAKLMGRPEIRAEVAAAMERRAKQTQRRAAQVLEELAGIAFAEASDESGAKLKVAGKLRALELLGKHWGLFEGAAAGPAEQVTIVEDV